MWHGCPVLRDVPGAGSCIELRAILWSGLSGSFIFQLSEGIASKKKMTGFFTILSSFNGMNGAV